MTGVQKKECVLHYSILLSLPLLGIISYLIQLLLVYAGLSRHFYLSSRGQRITSKVVRLLELKFTCFRCQTFFIGHTLTYFSSPIQLDVLRVKLDLSTQKNYQRVMWTLACSSSLTKKTKYELAKYFDPSFFELYH